MVQIHISSFDYVRKPAHPLHPAFENWPDQANPYSILIVWTLTSEHQTLPIAVLYAQRKVQVIEWLGVSEKDTALKKETIAKLATETEVHLFHRNKEVLHIQWPISDRVVPVKEEMFRQIGNNAYATARPKSNTVYLTDGFSKDGLQSKWEMKDDGSIQITEESGRKTVGSVVADDSIAGYNVKGPIQLEDDPDSRYAGNRRNSLIAHAIVAIMIMPIKRPAGMTDALGKYW